MGPATSCISILLCSAITYAVADGDNLQTINGVLVNVVDDCTPGDDTTCPDGKCCTKQNLVYTPDFTGPQPDYVLSCAPYKKQGESCFMVALQSTCPCEPTLHCKSVDGIFQYGSCAA